MEHRPHLATGLNGVNDRLFGLFGRNLACDETGRGNGNAIGDG